MRVKRVRTKSCCRCQIEKPTLFRVRIEKDGDWIFICEACLNEVKPNNEHYQYGGTWKSRKRH